MYESANKGTADYHFHQQTREGLLRAAELDPANARYLTAAGIVEQREGGGSTGWLSRAQAASPSDESIARELGLAHELAGNTSEAERHLLAAAALSRKHDPAWALANFYFRAGRTEDFWKWARETLVMAPIEPSLVFDLCWQVSPDGPDIARRVLPERRTVRLAFAQYLVSRKDPAGAAEVVRPVAMQIATHPAEEQRAAVLTDHLAVAYQTEAAYLLWKSLRNPAYERFGGFLWHGQYARQAGTALRVELDGGQAESAILLRKLIPVRSGQLLTLRWTAEMNLRSPAGPLRQSGVRWRLTRWSPKQEPLAESELIPATGSNGGQLTAVSAFDGGVAAVLEYQRLRGNMRAEGEVVIRSPVFEAGP